jgi:hypothetical protein
MKDTAPPERPHRRNKRTHAMLCLRFESLKHAGSKHFKITDKKEKTEKTEKKTEKTETNGENEDTAPPERKHRRE